MTLLISNINVSEKNVFPPKKINFKIHSFNDGSIKVRLATAIDAVQKLTQVNLTFAPYNLSDVMIALQMVSILKHFNPNLVIDLVYSSTLYTRYDRIMHSNGNDAFGLKLFIETLRPLLLQVTSVRLIDVHNTEVMTSLILDQNKDLAVYHYSLNSLIESSVGDLTQYHVVSTDEGCSKRLEASNIQPDLTFGKTRDLVTGKIGFIYLIKPLPNPSKPYLLVDDIVEYGGTFLSVSRKLPPTFPHYLYVTYGILPTEQSIIDLSEKFEKIYIHICHESTYARIKHLIITKKIPSDKFIVQTVMEQAYYV